MINTFDKFLEKIEDFLTSFAALAIFILMITATVQIVSRKILNMPIPGYIDFAEQSIAIFAFIGIGGTLGAIVGAWSTDILSSMSASPYLPVFLMLIGALFFSLSIIIFT